MYDQNCSYKSLLSLSILTVRISFILYTGSVLQKLYLDKNKIKEIRTEDCCPKLPMFPSYTEISILIHVRNVSCLFSVPISVLITICIINHDLSWCNFRALKVTWGHLSGFRTWNELEFRPRFVTLDDFQNYVRLR